MPFAFRPDLNGHIGTVLVHKNGITREERILGDIYRLEIEHFSNAILTDTDPAITADSTLKNMRTINACYRSLETGEKVHIEETEETFY